MKQKELDPKTLTVGQQVHVLSYGYPVGVAGRPLPVVTVKTVGRKWVTLSNGVKVALDQYRDSMNGFGVMAAL